MCDTQKKECLNKCKPGEAKCSSGVKPIDTSRIQLSPGAKAAKDIRNVAKSLGALIAQAATTEK